jgi:hypothetical protein
MDASESGRGDRNFRSARAWRAHMYVHGMKLERATYVTCDQCQALFKAGTFKDGTTPTACPTCRVGVDPKGQSVTIDTESRF